MRDRRGFTLVEAVVALALVAAVGVSVSTALVSGFAPKKVEPTRAAPPLSRGRVREAGNLRGYWSRRENCLAH